MPRFSFQDRDALAAHLETLRARGQKIVFTNGCFDILHAGHVELLQRAREAGDFLVVGLNSDASVQRLKGPSRPIHPQTARAQVLAALRCVDATLIFDEDTPIETIRALKPNIHVKGGDYRPDDLPEAQTVRDGGGEILIIPLVQGFSTTLALQKSLSGESDKTLEEAVKNLNESLKDLKGANKDLEEFNKPLEEADKKVNEIDKPLKQDDKALKEADKPIKEVNKLFGEVKGEADAIIVIPARFGSTRFPGKPLATLGGQTMIARVVRRALQTSAAKPVLVATDDTRIAAEIGAHFEPNEALAVMTSPACHTGTDRLAAAIAARFGKVTTRKIVVNVQGDEPFIEPSHIEKLIELMRADDLLPMATLAAPLENADESDNPNIVKVARSEQGRALYFSRAAIPFDRDGAGAPRLRHIGIYAYDARWLTEMASLPPSNLEEIEKLEQLRALEHGVAIGVALVEHGAGIAIDTPEDLARAESWLREQNLA